MRESTPPPDPARPENARQAMSPEEEADLRHAVAETEDSRRGDEELPPEELLRQLRSREPIELDPEEEEELERRSREAHDLDAQGLLPSAEDHIRRLRAILEQRRAG